jgi:hypothetical protein
MILTPCASGALKRWTSWSLAASSRMLTSSSLRMTVTPLASQP